MPENGGSPSFKGKSQFILRIAGKELGWAHKLTICWYILRNLIDLGTDIVLGALGTHG
jgi:hypothetical protein